MLVRSYTAGLAAEGLIVDESDVQYGMDVGLVVRSAFTALPLERLADACAGTAPDEPVADELASLVAARLELTRYLVDLGLTIPAA